MEIRKAEKQDVGKILSFIHHLADYEKLSDEVVATEESLLNTLFCENPKAHCLLCFSDGKAVGFALYFYNYSTFLAKNGIYLEDLFVLEEERGKGYGKSLLKALAKIAVEQNCGRLEWSVLDWNEPSIQFYKNCGAVPMDGWTVFRLTGDSLSKFAGE